jgi:hypothetical protein
LVLAEHRILVELATKQQEQSHQEEARRIALAAVLSADKPDETAPERSLARTKKTTPTVKTTARKRAVAA